MRVREGGSRVGGSGHWQQAGACSDLALHSSFQHKHPKRYIAWGHCPPPPPPPPATQEAQGGGLPPPPAQPLPESDEAMVQCAAQQCECGTMIQSQQLSSLVACLQRVLHHGDVTRRTEGSTGMRQS